MAVADMAVPYLWVLENLFAVATWEQGETVEGFIRDLGKAAGVGGVDMTDQRIDARKRSPCQWAPLAGAMEQENHGGKLDLTVAPDANSKIVARGTLLATISLKHWMRVAG